MNTELAITIGIGILAGLYVAKMGYGTVRKLLKPAPGCSGCSGCGTPKGHAENEDSCTVRNKLPVLK